MVLSFQPRSELLRKYIYQFNTFDPEAALHINYLAFPQLGSTLFFLNKANIDSSGHQLFIQPAEKAGPGIALLGKYTVPITLSYRGYVEEISIDFTPLGINYFFDAPYDSLAPHYFQKLSKQRWSEFSWELYATDTLSNRLSRLETFLENEYRDRQLHILQRAVDLLMQVDSEVDVQQVSTLAGISQKTLLRNFQKYAGCSPQLFKRIVRFRHSIKLRQLNEQTSSLTQLGYESQFYDSSHFGREYRLLTGRCPKEFFRSISFVGDHQYPYLFS